MISRGSGKKQEVKVCVLRRCGEEYFGNDKTEGFYRKRNRINLNVRKRIPGEVPGILLVLKGALGDMWNDKRFGICHKVRKLNQVVFRCVTE